MPRVYTCKKCGKGHAPPTGRGCRELRTETEEENDTSQEMLDILVQIRGRMDSMDTKFQQVDDRLQQVETRQTEEVNNIPRPVEAEVSGNSNANNELIAASGAANRAEGEVSPASLRRDISLMAEAANRIAQLGIDDENEQDESATTYRRRTTGKKSGSLMLAAEVVKKTIDWPHLHVRRMVAGRKKSIPYAELNVEEFVCRFLGMIKAPTCKWDYREIDAYSPYHHAGYHRFFQDKCLGVL